ncbi:MAG: hypothetical protein EOO50_13335 [Flavobacterium sp.]|uniref:hypothetical protein n=1 Tax=Flavobacterium sp. TaxID=239 RepID=UPI0011FCAC90|nr:hypothetical protein [Flavobacterium sp.]RZJ65524.1 MAG: hypothetical protein EOO50_13335 [Flavobacterium sp.]
MAAIFSPCQSQTFGDPVRKDTIKYDRFPSYPLLKILSVSYDYAGKSDYKVDFKDTDIDESGEFTRSRMQVYAWIPIIQKRKITVSLAETYTREDITLRNVVNPSGVYVNGNETLEDFNTSINVNYRTKLFSKQLVLNGSVFVGTSPAFEYQKLTGSVYGLLILKDSPRTIYSVGLAGLIDPSAPLPVIPAATYWHRFDDPRWELDVIFPQTAKIRRSNIGKGWVSAGADLVSPSFFIRNVPGQSASYESAFNEITPNIGYDKLFFSKSILLTVQGGYRYAMKGRLVEVNDPARDRIADVEFNSGWYVKGGISWVILNWKVRRVLDEAMK